jgi:hypothetical protein
MRVLFDRMTNASTQQFWDHMLIKLSSTRNYDGRDVQRKLFVIGSHESFRDTDITPVPFPERKPEKFAAAADADLLTSVARSWDIDVFVSTGHSYVTNIPQVVVRLDSDSSLRSLAVATALSSQIVVRSNSLSRDLRRDFGFPHSGMIHVSRDENDVECLNHAVISAIDTASSETHPWRADEILATLVTDYQERAIRLQT